MNSPATSTELSPVRSLIWTKKQLPDVDFMFANADPIRLDFDQQALKVKLRLKRLRVGSAVWRNIIVSSTYNVSAQGLHCRLTQAVPGISLKGKNLRLRDQLVVRTVFSKSIVTHLFVFSG